MDSRRLRALLPDHLVDIGDLSDAAISTVVAATVERVVPDMAPPRRVGGIAFFQPSTRTLLSFQSAGFRIGLPMVSLPDLRNTRVGDFYGETPEDAILYMQTFTDLLVVRHHRPLHPPLLELVTVPLINAGDGYNSHPTQALGDLAALIDAVGPRLDSLRIGILGSMSLRTTHSFVQAVQRISAAKVTCLRSQVDAVAAEALGPTSLADSKEELLSICDVIYVSGFDHADFNSAYTPWQSRQQHPVIAKGDLTGQNRDVLVMHPGPKSRDLDKSLDSNSNNLVWKQSSMATRARELILSAYSSG